jgi:uncharacterized protein (DUF433 family)
MHYELWALNTGNLMRDYDTQAEVLESVRDLIANGWDAYDLGVRLEWDDGDEGNDDLLPPSLYGASLAAWAAEGRAGIESRPDVVGGSAGVRRTRIPVWVLERARRLGLSEAEIIAAFPTLQPEDLRHAWVYVWTHRDEINRDIDENEAA